MSTRHSLSIRWSIPPGSRQRSAPVRPVSEASDRESFLAEIKTLNAPAFDAAALDGMERSRVLRPGAASPARRPGARGEAACSRRDRSTRDAVHSAARKWMSRPSRGESKSALVEVMEASRDFERFRDPVAQQADDLEAPHDKRRSIHSRARAMELELPPVPDIPHAGIRSAVDALAPVPSEAITDGSVRSPQVGPGGRQRWLERLRQRSPARATRSSSCWLRYASR